MDKEKTIPLKMNSSNTCVEKYTTIMFIQGFDEQNVQCSDKLFFVSNALYEMSLDYNITEDEVILFPYEKATKKIIEKLVEWINFKNPTTRVVFKKLEDSVEFSEEFTFEQNFNTQVSCQDKEWFQNLVNNAFEKNDDFTVNDVYDLLYLAHIYEMDYIEQCLAFYIAKNLEKEMEQPDKSV